jgi:hypothetical protein
MAAACSGTIGVERSSGGMRIQTTDPPR